MHLLQWVDEIARLTNIISHGVGDELVDHLLQFTAGHGTGDDIHHLLADILHLCVLCVGRLAGLAGHFLGEANAEDAQDVAVCGLDISVGLDASLGVWRVLVGVGVLGGREREREIIIDRKA